jgi:hypothetical protein
VLENYEFFRRKSAAAKYQTRAQAPWRRRLRGLDDHFERTLKQFWLSEAEALVWLAVGDAEHFVDNARALAYGDYVFHFLEAGQRRPIRVRGRVGRRSAEVD